jgi:hypothetical protein
MNYREQRVSQYMRTFFTRFDKFYHRDTNIKKTGIVYEFYEAYTLNINYFSIFVHAKDIYNIAFVNSEC